ncbi:hypothetical protein FSP39_002752 [Pinctada imbricata]|uniref:HTH CENPB-type domain-containing protein n=1 Tax=Pinctada imbricata TaxID=66713 RepID=A0AA88YUR3_PINIB|nr:hypothetical protein FSP39_002752 [Pinctada imbricata]
MEGALTQWFTETVSREIPLSGPVLTEKATDLVEQLNEPNFSTTVHSNFIASKVLRRALTDSIHNYTVEEQRPETNIAREKEKMATRLLASRSRVTAYLPSFQAVVRHFSAFPNYEEPQIVYEEESDNPRSKEQLKLGPFGADDKRFPLPGKIGLPNHLVMSQQTTMPSSSIQDPETMLEKALPVDRQRRVITQTMHISQATEEQYLIEPKPSPSDILECVAQDCPAVLRKDYSDLFPDRDIMKGSLTIVTISHRTMYDMSGWSQNVENEREMLLAAFIQAACDICQNLIERGYWADFIDPSSGKPYLGHHTNSAMFETDERYKKLGFEIEDLGCCKVISHHLWGTHSYVGCLFTNAKVDDPILQSMQEYWKD